MDANTAQLQQTLSAMCKSTALVKQSRSRYSSVQPFAEHMLAAMTHEESKTELLPLMCSIATQLHCIPKSSSAVLCNWHACADRAVLQHISVFACCDWTSHRRASGGRISQFCHTQKRLLTLCDQINRRDAPQGSCVGLEAVCLRWLQSSAGIAIFDTRS